MKKNKGLLLFLVFMFVVLNFAHTEIAAAQEPKLTSFKANPVDGNMIVLKWTALVNSRVSVAVAADCTSGSISFDNNGHTQSCTPNSSKYYFGHMIGLNSTGIGTQHDPSIFTELTKDSRITILSNSKKQTIPFTLFMIEDGEIIDEIVKKVSVPKTSEITKKQTVEVIYPNGGETVRPGETVKIKWKTKGIPLNPYTQVDLMDSRITDWTTKSLFGSVPALEHSRLVSSKGDEYTYEHLFVVPNDFRGSLPYQYKNIFGGKYYTVNVIVQTGEGSASLSQQVTDTSDKKFTIKAVGVSKNSPDLIVSDIYTERKGEGAYASDQMLVAKVCNIGKKTATLPSHAADFFTQIKLPNNISLYGTNWDMNRRALRVPLSIKRNECILSSASLHGVNLSPGIVSVEAIADSNHAPGWDNYIAESNELNNSMKKNLLLGF